MGLRDDSHGTWGGKPQRQGGRSYGYDNFRGDNRRGEDRERGYGYGGGRGRPGYDKYGDHIERDELNGYGYSYGRERERGRRGGRGGRGEEREGEGGRGRGHWANRDIDNRNSDYYYGDQRRGLSRGGAPDQARNTQRNANSLDDSPDSRAS